MLTSLMISWRQGVDIAVGEGIIIQYPTLGSSWGIRKVLCTWEISSNFRFDLNSRLLFFLRVNINLSLVHMWDITQTRKLGQTHVWLLLVCKRLMGLRLLNWNLLDIPYYHYNLLPVDYNKPLLNTNHNYP